MEIRPIDANALKENGYYLVRVTREQTDLGRVTTRQEVSLDEVPTLDYAPVGHGEWVLTESPYAEYEEGVDGESHDRWTCSLCGGEAGFECDPDGFASFQDKTKFCGHCGAEMRKGDA